ncbi:hypothetical protein ACI2KR_30400 [Pseudomonas luteola]
MQNMPNAEHEGPQGPIDLILAEQELGLRQDEAINATNLLSEALLQIEQLKAAVKESVSTFRSESKIRGGIPMRWKEVIERCDSALQLPELIPGHQQAPSDPLPK